MNDNGKRPEADIKIGSDNKFLRWLENFWYHYKWHTIVVAFIVIVVGVCSWQFFTKEEPDIVILYAGSSEIEGKDAVKVGELLSTVIPSDYNKDGKKEVLLKNFLIYSKEEILAQREQNKSTGDGTETGYPYIDGYRNTSTYQNYTQYMQTGDASVCLVEPWLYNEIKAEYKMPLSEIFGEEIPKGAIDAYGIRLGDTDIYRHYELLNKNFSPDTVIFMQAPLYTEGLFGKKENEKKIEYEKSVLAALGGFVSDMPSDTVADTVPVSDTVKREEDSDS